MKLSLECLELRLMPCSPSDVLIAIDAINNNWYNIASDINNDGILTPSDVLAIINAVNARSKECGSVSPFSVKARVNGYDADIKPGLVVEAYDTVFYGCTIKNNGITPLSNVLIANNLGLDFSNYAGDINENGVLDRGETWFCVSADTAAPGLSELLVEVLATNIVGQQLKVSDYAYIFGFQIG